MNALPETFDGSLATRVPRNVRELVEWLASPTMFHCMQGLPRAYMEIPDSQSGRTVRGVYQSFRYAVPASRADAESALVAAMHDVFAEARAQYDAKFADTPLLFWRRMPCIEEYAPGALCMGTDGNGSDVYNQGWLTFLYCRVWVPGLVLPALDDANTNFIT